MLYVCAWLLSAAPMCAGENTHMPAAEVESDPDQLFQQDTSRSATTLREGGRRSRGGGLLAPTVVTPPPRAPRSVVSQQANAVISMNMRGRLAQPIVVDASSQHALRSELAQKVNTFMSQSYAEASHFCRLSRRCDQ